MAELEEIKQMLAQSRVEDAVTSLSELIANNADDDQAHYLLGNAYAALGNWGKALTSYCRAMEINPDSPAAEAYRRAQEILDFYCHDLYNP